MAGQPQQRAVVVPSETGPAGIPAPDGLPAIRRLMIYVAGRRR